jgi:hypothetical protein
MLVEAMAAAKQYTTAVSDGDPRRVQAGRSRRDG